MQRLYAVYVDLYISFGSWNNQGGIKPDSDISPKSGINNCHNQFFFSFLLHFENILIFGIFGLLDAFVSRRPHKSSNCLSGPGNNDHQCRVL